MKQSGNTYEIAIGEQRGHVERLRTTLQQSFLLCCGLILALLLSLSANVYQASTLRVEAFVVPIEATTGGMLPAFDLLRARDAHPVIEAGRQRLIADFIEKIHTVTADWKSNVKAYNEAYQIAQGPARNYLTLFHQDLDPGAITHSGRTIYATTTSVLQTGERTYTVEFFTESHNPQGHKEIKRHYKAFVEIRTAAVKDPDLLIRNPLQTFITKLRWSALLPGGQPR